MRTERDGGELSARVLLSILRRYARFGLLVAVAGGLLVHLGLGLYAAQKETQYNATFEVRYRSGSTALAGLRNIVGNLPSLTLRSTLETQEEILKSGRLRLGALRRLKAHQGKSEAELLEVKLPFQVKIKHKDGTDILVAIVRGTDREGVLEYSRALLTEYHSQDLRAKRSKDTELQKYLEAQIRIKEKRILSLSQVLTAHREVAPLEEARSRAKKRVEEAQEALRLEQRKRRNTRDALLEKYTDDHPSVVQANEALKALATIVGAEAHDALKPFLGGVEAQWAALRADTFEEARQAKSLGDRIQKIRTDIGKRFKKQLRAGADPAQVKREHRLAQETYEGLRRRLGSVELSIQDSTSDVDTHTQPAVVAEKPFQNRWQWSLGLGLMCGLLTPFLLEALVVTSHTVADLERVAGLPVLAAVPRLNENDTNGTGLMVAGSAASDELRLLRTNIESALDYPGRRLILVAGAEPGEGKSMVAANLAGVYAEMGVPTLLVDLDLRRPVVHEQLRLRRGPGITEIVGQKTPWKRCVQMPDLDNLHVIPAGAATEDSGGLLATVRLAEVLSEMREVFSVVICDSPALTAVADASLVARRADAVVLVYALATTPHRSLARTLSMLNTAKAKVVGLVANDKRGLSSKRSYRYGYYYQRGARVS